ncbi:MULTISPECIES: hypothetical protein [unclassified Romboutsia]|uniref:hypothetical protein n=1 Tax=unclassified Romboutsia TaxID=2626894 RepID=UPI0008207DC6|nr:MULTISPECIES: hypothetical protein [unclassified Romboutsia]SCH62741.1 Uncharacterised protein [uncultured Clostridium sp.]
MKINYNTLNNLVKHNNGMKLVFRENSNILDVYINNKICLTLELENNDLEYNSKLIYNSIISLKNVTLYIPKIYIKD